MSTAARERIPHPDLGAHEMYFQPPCLMWITQHGDISASEMTAILDASATTNERDIIALIDINDLGIISAEARKIAAEKSSVFRVLTLFGGSRVQRALGNLMLRVISLVQKNAVQTKIFKNEHEATVWVKAELKAENL